MPGLLSDIGDFIYGDETVKDADGRTQYDRRQPYFQGIGAGIGKMGGLLMAAGMPMHADQRAQIMAQAGNAFGGIPGDIIAAREAQSKGILQQQTVTANRTKLANQAKIIEMGKTPEAQAAMAKLDPARRAAMQAAYDSGDIKSVVDLIESSDKVGSRTQALELATQKYELARQKQEQGGSWKGTGLENQALNLMERGAADPTFRKSLAYKDAYETLKQGKEYFDKDADDGRGRIVSIRPRNMDHYWPPEYTGGPPAPGAPPVPPPVVPPPPAPAPPPADGTAPPPAPAPSAPAPGGGPPVVPPPVVPPPGSGAPGPVVPAPGVVPPGSIVAPPGAPAPPRVPSVVRLPGGGDATSTPLGGQAKGPPPAAIEKFNNHKVGANTLIAAMEDWRNELRTATKGDKAAAVSGFTNNLTTSAGLSQMLAKGDALLELGVLNGQDLPVIQSILPDPKTFKGTLADAEAAIDKVKSIVEYRIKLREALLYGRPEPEMPALVKRAASAPQGGGTYVMPSGRKVTQRDVEETAKMHGVTVEQVMRDLKLKKE